MIIDLSFPEPNWNFSQACKYKVKFMTWCPIIYVVLPFLLKIKLFKGVQKCWIHFSFEIFFTTSSCLFVKSKIINKSFSTSLHRFCGCTL